VGVDKTSCLEDCHLWAHNMKHMDNQALPHRLYFVPTQDNVDRVVVSFASPIYIAAYGLRISPPRSVFLSASLPGWPTPLLLRLFKCFYDLPTNMLITLQFMFPIKKTEVDQNT
jgi:hypothetical protein